MYKLIQNQADYFGGEPLASVIDLHEDFMTKHASADSDIAKFAKSLKPREDGIYLHINALGGEHWGSNSNSDYFESEVLAHECSMDMDTNRKDDYGFKTFEKYAYPFKHHANANIERSVGEKVAFSTYNKNMDRVELVVFIDRKKDPELCKKAEVGEAIPVSMGCFIAGTNVVLPDYSVVPIETLCVGDRVLTHDGSAQQITELHKRSYSGDFYKIKGWNVPEFTCTEEHPLMTVKKSDVYKVYPNDNDRYQHGTFKKEMLKWTHAKCVEVGDLLAFPINQDVYTPDFITKDLAKFLGYYLAEGHILKNKKGEYVGVQFSVHRDDAIMDDIEDICRSIGTYNKPVIRECPHSEFSRAIYVHDRNFAEMCSSLCGMYAKEKRLDESVMLWDPELQLEFLGAYIDGDGCVSNGKWQPGSITISTASEHLSKQIQALCLRCGIIPGLQRIRHRNGGFNHHETLEYQIYIGKTYSFMFSDVSKKAKDLLPPKVKKHTKYLEDGYLLIPIRSIGVESNECDVYNFEVENHESYVVEYSIVHNCKVLYDTCSICGHHSKTIASYCEHLKYASGQVMPDGRKVYASNAYPRFFDISFVLIPAEKASYVMNKVASARSSQIVVPSAFIAEALGIEQPKISEDKAAEIKKEIPVNEVQTEQPGRDVMKAFVSLVPKVSSLEPDMSESTMKGVSEFPLRDILSTATGMGMVLKPKEFRRIVVIKCGNGVTGESPDISSDAMNVKVASLLKEYVVDRSAFRPALRARLVKLAGATPVKPVQTLQQDVVSKGLPTAAALAALYDAYRSKVSKAQGSFIMDALSKKPILVAILGAIAAAGVGMLGQSLEKTAKLGKIPKGAIAGSLAYPYLVKAHKEQEYFKKGKEPGDIGKLFIKHPGLIGLASLYPTLKVMRKFASVSDVVRHNKVLSWPLVEDAPNELVDIAIVNGFYNL